MKSVWIINHYATDPAESASGSRHYSLARHLVDHGWMPSILAASTEHPTGLQRVAGRVRVHDRHVQGIHFRFLRAPTYQGNGIWRILNILAFTLMLLLPSSTKGLRPPDAILGSTVHPFAAWAASVLAHRHRVPFIFEIRDLWPQTFIDMGKMTRSSIPARALRLIERVLCRRATTVVTLLPFADRYLIEQGVSPEKIAWISNGCDAVEFEHMPVRDARGEFTFMYLGSVGRANGVEDIVRAFAPLAGTARLEIYGAGPRLPQVQEVIRGLGVADAVAIRDAIPKAQVPRVASGADAFVINVLDLDVYRHGISMNKLFDYLAAARPIVIASNAPNNPVVDADAGVSVRAADAELLGEGMRRILEAPLAERARWGNNGRRHVELEFDYRVLAQRLASVLDDSTTGGSGVRNRR